MWALEDGTENETSNAKTMAQVLSMIHGWSGRRCGGVWNTPYVDVDVGGAKQGEIAGLLRRLTGVYSFVDPSSCWGHGLELVLGLVAVAFRGIDLVMG